MYFKDYDKALWYLHSGNRLTTKKDANSVIKNDTIVLYSLKILI